MRGAIAIVTIAGRDAVDAGEAASRDMWVTAVFGQDGSSVVRIPLGQKRRLAFGWKAPLDYVTDDQIKGVRPGRFCTPGPSPWAK
jgi:hypothetical protein